MKNNILLTNIGMDVYKNYDKSNLLKAIKKYSKHNIYIIITKFMDKDKILFYKNNANIIYLENINVKLKEDMRTYKDVKEITDHMMLLNKINMKYFDSYLKENIEIYSKVYNILINYKINKTLVWGSSFMPYMVTKISHRLNIPHLILEEGYFREYGIQYSHIGSNVQSEIIEEYNLFLQKNKQKYNHKKIKTKKYNKLFNNKKTKKQLEYDDYKIDNILLNESYVFVPLQINSDTQIILNSPFIKSMYDFVEIIIKTINYYNEKYNKKIKIIFKIHPEQNTQDKFFDINEIYQTFKKNAFFVKNYNLNQIILNSKLVITINSTVGILALNMNKKVMVLGKSIYSLENIVFCVNDINYINEKFKESMHNTKNEEDINKFTDFLMNKQLKINVTNPSKKDIKNLFSKFNRCQKRYFNINNSQYVTTKKFVNFRFKFKEGINNYNFNINYNDILIVNSTNRNFYNMIKKFGYYELNNISITKYKNFLKTSDNITCEAFYLDEGNRISIPQFEYNLRYNLKYENNINYCFKKNIGKKLIITFPAYSGIVGNLSYPITVLNSINIEGYSILAFQDFNFMLGSAMLYDYNFEKIVDKVLKIIEKIKIKNDISDDNIIFFGSSKGGYSALYYSSFYKNSKIIAYSPVTDFYEYNKYYYAGKILKELIELNNLEYPKIKSINNKKGIIRYSLFEEKNQIDIFNKHYDNFIIEGYNLSPNKVAEQSIINLLSDIKKLV